MEGIVYIILGLTTGIILGKIYDDFCERKKTYSGPDSNIIKNNIYIDSGGKCYKLVPKVHICPT